MKKSFAIRFKSLLVVISISCHSSGIYFRFAGSRRSFLQKMGELQFWGNCKTQNKSLNTGNLRLMTKIEPGIMVVSYCVH